MGEKKQNQIWLKKNYIEPVEVSQNFQERQGQMEACDYSGCPPVSNEQRASLDDSPELVHLAGFKSLLLYF